jgi:hypothetical protein
MVAVNFEAVAGVPSPDNRVCQVRWLVGVLLMNLNISLFS